MLGKVTELQAALTVTSSCSKEKGFVCVLCSVKNNSFKGGFETSPVQGNKKVPLLRKATLYLYRLLQKAVRLVFFIYCIMFKPSEQALVLCEVTQT